MKITIYDVAKAMNLSPGTISKILNNNGSIGEETRDRVLRYVKEVGYVAESSARILKSKFSYTIGVIFSDISLVGLEHPFFGSIIQHFKTYVEREGYEIVFITSKIGTHEMSYLDWCRNKKVNGVFIVSGNINNAYILELVASDLPCVSSDIIIPGMHSVISDDAQGMRLAFEHLRSLGIDRIGTLVGPQTSRAFAERFDNYKALLAEHGLPLRPEWICESHGFGYTSAVAASEEWFATIGDMPRAILAQSDDIAYGLIHALQRRGYRVPEDVAVVGYDDISFSRLFTPPLTTIRQDRRAIGERSAAMLIDYIVRGNGKGTSVDRVPVELVVRASTPASHV
ncbi:MAG: LacI family DNA-binding transcriptional regulator [Candidatus Izemoplasmatales bacterium]